MASTTDQTTAPRARRYPRTLITTLDTPQDREIRAFAAAVNRSISEVARDALAAGLPILRRRAEEDGIIPSEVAA
jgi:hypothetical protein